MYMHMLKHFKTKTYVETMKMKLWTKYNKEKGHCIKPKIRWFHIKGTIN